MLFVVLCPGTPEGSTGSGSGFNASQKTGQRLKVSSDRLGEAGNRTCDPWLTRHRCIPYTTELQAPVVRVKRLYINLLVKHKIFPVFWKIYNCMHFEKKNAFHNAKYYIFQKENN